MNLQLDHVTPECTGRWEHHGTYWRCDTCQMVYYHADDVAEALTAETDAGDLLHRLAEEGERE
jgi:hypothetical protein